MIDGTDELNTTNSNSFPDAAISAHINSNYNFIIIIKPTKKSVSLSLQKIYQLNKPNIELYSINHTALSAAIN